MSLLAHRTLYVTDLFVQDLNRNLYDSYYINFCSTIPRPLLEEFAATTMAQDTSDLVSQVCMVQRLFLGEMMRALS